LILRGHKTIEVRDWNPTRRGPILLHASLTIDWQAIELFGYSKPWALPRGRLVGYARITDAFQFTLERWRASAEEHLVMRPLRGGDYGARLEDIRSFRSPVVCPGKLLFFSIPPRVLERARKELSNLNDAP